MSKTKIDKRPLVLGLLCDAIDDERIKRNDLTILLRLCERYSPKLGYASHGYAYLRRIYKGDKPLNPSTVARAVHRLMKHGYIRRSYKGYSHPNGKTRWSRYIPRGFAELQG